MPSILRNPLIANILFLSEDVEKWGSGLRRIYEECALQGVKVEFEVLEYGFSVIFYRSKSDKNQTKIGSNFDTNRIQIGHKSDEETRQEWIINYLKANKSIRSKDIIQKFKIVKDTASRDLNKLIEQDIIIKKGAGNNVWYELK